MNKLNERLTLIANLSVVVGIIFRAVELQQNTQAIQAQTRDSITGKQMEFSSWVATNRDLAEVLAKAPNGLAELDSADFQMLSFFLHGLIREWENSDYQYQRGLFTAEEFEARLERWRQSISSPAFRAYWEGQRQTFAPSFRAEIDRIVAEATNAEREQ